jgi:hypothetical protein
MSAIAGSAALSVVSTIRSSSRPMARAKATGVFAALQPRNSLNAASI